MGSYTVQEVVRAGVVPTENAVAASDTFSNDGHTILIVTNGSGGSVNVTLTTPGTVDGLAVADRVVAVGNGVKKAIGPFPRSLYNDSDGKVTVAYDGTTSVTAMALSI